MVTTIKVIAVAARRSNRKHRRHRHHHHHHRDDHVLPTDTATEANDHKENNKSSSQDDKNDTTNRGLDDKKIDNDNYKHDENEDEDVVVDVVPKSEFDRYRVDAEAKFQSMEQSHQSMKQDYNQLLQRLLSTMKALKKNHNNKNKNQKYDDVDVDNDIIRQQYDEDAEDEELVQLLKETSNQQVGRTKKKDGDGSIRSTDYYDDGHSEPSSTSLLYEEEDVFYDDEENDHKRQEPKHGKKDPPVRGTVSTEFYDDGHTPLSSTSLLDEEEDVFYDEEENDRKQQEPKHSQHDPPVLGTAATLATPSPAATGPSVAIATADGNNTEDTKVSNDGDDTDEAMMRKLPLDAYSFILIIGRRTSRRTPTNRLSVPSKSPAAREQAVSISSGGRNGGGSGGGGVSMDGTGGSSCSYYYLYNYHGVSIALGWFIFLVQLLLMALLVANRIDFPSKDNPFRIPGNVPPSVRIAQCFALLISVMLQDDFFIGLMYLTEGYNTDDSHGTSTRSSSATDQDQFRFRKWSWFTSFGLRLVQGAVLLTLSFLLVIQEQDVFSLLLNLTGIQFVSALDDVAYQLAERGYFGQRNQETAEKIQQVMYHLPTGTKDRATGMQGRRRNSAVFHNTSSVERVTWSKQLHVIVLLLVLVLLYGGWGVIVYQQRINQFLCKELQITLSDSVLPILGTYSGRYDRQHSTTTTERYVSYLERRGQLTREKDGNHNVTIYKGFFGYCIGENAWTFANNLESDPCSNILMKSIKTTTFDITELGSQTWFSAYDGHPIQNVQIACQQHGSSVPAKGQDPKIDDDVATCKDRLSFQQRSGTTDIINDNERPIIDFYPLLCQHDPKGGGKRNLESKDNLTAAYCLAYDRPVYIGHSLEIILFAGTRWIFTNMDSLLPVSTGENDEGGDDENDDNGVETKNATSTNQRQQQVLQRFFQNNDFHMSLVSMKGILHLSEIADVAVHPDLPTGLRWHRAHYNSNALFIIIIIIHTCHIPGS